MKFDVIIGNPPYKKGLHMKILEKCFNVLSENGELIFVHPSFPFINLKSNIHEKLLNKIKNNVKSLTLINGNKLFDAGLFVPCSITFLDKKINNNGIIELILPNKSKHIFDDISKVNLFGNRKELFSFMEKLEKSTSILNYELTEEQAKKYQFIVDFSGIRGHISSNNNVDQFNEFVANDFYTIFPRNQQVAENKTEDFKSIIFGFNTYKEAENFINYLKTNFARKSLSLLKINQHLENGRQLRLIPWLDFSEKWTDEKLFKHFELNEQEIQFVNEITPYYEN